MGVITDKLDNIRVADNESLRELYDVFRSIADYELPIIRTCLTPGASVIRQRINDNGRVFGHISELSYPPVAMTSMNRVNLPGRPMFYACKFPMVFGEDDPIPRKIALEETSDFMKCSTNHGIERATVSRWNIVDRLELIALPFLGNYPKACSEVRQVRKEWATAIGKGVVPKNALELVNYMAIEISKDFKNKDQYFKIANFVYYLLELCSKTKESDGILYPSVPSQGSGINVAIKPSAFEKKIQFAKASICHLIKRGLDMHVFIMQDAIVDEFGNLIYLEKVLSDINKAYYENLCQGLDYVN